MNFPAELFEPILAHLAQGHSPDFQSLRSCSYASTAFCLAARKHLFAEITLDLIKLRIGGFGLCERPGASLGYKFLDLLDAAPHIAPLVKTIRVSVKLLSDHGSKSGDVVDELDAWLAEQGIYPDTNTHIDDKEIFKPTLSTGLLLPRLPNLQTLHLACMRCVVWDWDLLHDASQKAILDASVNKLTTLNTTHVLGFPFERICKSQTLKHLMLNPSFVSEELVDKSEGTRYPISSMTVTPSYFDASPAGRDRPRGKCADFFKHPQCAISLAKLRHLVLEDHRLLEFEPCFPLCASLETLAFRTEYEHVTHRCDYGKLALLPFEVPGHVDNEKGRPLDFSVFHHLQDLVIHTKIRDLAEWGGYYTSALPWIGATLQSIPSNGTLSRITINVEVEGFKKGRIVEVDFSPLSRALVEVDQSEHAPRIRTLRALDIDFHHNGFRSVWEDNYMPDLKRLGVFQDLDKLGVLHLTHSGGYSR